MFMGKYSGPVSWHLRTCNTEKSLEPSQWKWGSFHFYLDLDIVTRQIKTSTEHHIQRKICKLTGHELHLEESVILNIPCWCWSEYSLPHFLSISLLVSEESGKIFSKCLGLCHPSAVSNLDEVPGCCLAQPRLWTPSVEWTNWWKNSNSHLHINTPLKRFKTRSLG